MQGGIRSPFLIISTKLPHSLGLWAPSVRRVGARGSPCSQSGSTHAVHSTEKARITKRSRPYPLQFSTTTKIWENNFSLSLWKIQVGDIKAQVTDWYTQWSFLLSCVEFWFWSQESESRDREKCWKQNAHLSHFTGRIWNSHSCSLWVARYTVSASEYAGHMGEGLQRDEEKQSQAFNSCCYLCQMVVLSGRERGDGKSPTYPIQKILV